MRRVALIQARMGSTRLPGKTLRPLLGKPLLQHILERVRQSTCLDELVIATTTAPEDREVVALGASLGIASYTGDAEDVLDRFCQAARAHQADLIVRITADDPFKDPDVIDLITGHLEDHWGALDYVSNTIVPTYPEGIDVEVFTMGTLDCAWREATRPTEREHVTPYIWNHPDRFRLHNVSNAEDLSGLRWTLDYEQDWAFAEAVYQRLYSSDRVFKMADILALLAREPQLAEINAGVPRYAGYMQALTEKDG